MGYVLILFSLLCMSVCNASDTGYAGKKRKLGDANQEEPAKKSRSETQELFDQTVAGAVKRGKKGWRCAPCSKYFKSEHALISHRLSHTGEKPFKCYCTAEFAKKISLQRHQEKHSKGALIIQCPQCPLKFKTQYSLIRHLNGFQQPHKVPLTPQEAPFPAINCLKQELSSDSHFFAELLLTEAPTIGTLAPMETDSSDAS